MKNIGFLSLLLIGVVSLSVFSQTTDGRNKQGDCEYPSLGQYRILGEKPVELNDFRTFRIGYVGVDRTEDAGMPGRVSLRGSLTLDHFQESQNAVAPSFRKNDEGFAQSYKLEFLKAELIISHNCERRVFIITEPVQEKHYEIDAIILDKWRIKNGSLYKLTGTIKIFRKGKKVFTYTAKFEGFGDN